MNPSPPMSLHCSAIGAVGINKHKSRCFQAVYGELYRQAARYLRREPPSLTLQTIDLIHEAYVGLIDQERVEWKNRLHFVDIVALDEALLKLAANEPQQSHVVWYSDFLATSVWQKQRVCPKEL